MAPRTTRATPPEIVAAVAPARLFAGTSGWAYPRWKPGFYPEGLAQRYFLTHYASQLTSVEVNYTFRALPTAKMLGDWLGATPGNFRFSFKAPQRITHLARLRECSDQVAKFLDALAPVRDAGRMGLVLFQLPPNFAADADRLRAFLDLRALREAPPVAWEFRHASWFSDEVRTVLSEHNHAVSIAESDDLQTPEIHTSATHAAYRLRRNGGYRAEELQMFAERMVPMCAERDVYVYFKHEDAPTGALNAREFLAGARGLQGDGVGA